MIENDTAVDADTAIQAFKLFQQNMSAVDTFNAISSAALRTCWLKMELDTVYHCH